ncbi:hypothetical protein BASA62_006252 [Batrachochytrium salamandrivorans]|nr:hypothetical protein BASA62_006252 [Batrachochytrium salamandrivorans]
MLVSLCNCSTDHWCRLCLGYQLCHIHSPQNDRAAGRLVFPPTTLAQKEVILSNVENALAIWANYDSKKANYGRLPTHSLSSRNCARTSKTITDEELQLGLTDAFVMTRDSTPAGPIWHHTAASMPPPALTFTFIEGDADIIKKPTVVVTSTSKHPDLLALFGEDYSKIQAGDELLAINGTVLFLTGSSRTSSHLVLVPMNLVDSALLLNILLRYMGNQPSAE